MTIALPPAACRLIGAAVLSLAFVACTSAASSAVPGSQSAGSSAATSSASASGASGSGASASGASASGASASGASASASLSPSGHVDATVAGLDQALELYRAGDLQGALDEVAETYEDHFEHIEGPLEKVNTDLKEDLEALIATKLRAAITAKATVAEFEALVVEARTKLAIAKGLLK